VEVRSLQRRKLAVDLTETLSRNSVLRKTIHCSRRVCRITKTLSANNQSAPVLCKLPHPEVSGDAYLPVHLSPAFGVK
jgi:hypothetical protein